MSYNILISTIGRRGTLTKIFKKELNKTGGKVIVTDNSPLAPALYQADKYYLTPRIDDDRYIAKILKICLAEDIEAIIPLLEKSFSVFNQGRELFAESGIRLLLSPDRIIGLCQDKYRFYQYFKEKNISTAETYLPVELVEANGSFSFPLFIKPRQGQGSTRTFRINNLTELNFFINYLNDSIVQEYIEGEEYTIDLLSDFEGRVLSAVPRKRIEVRAGEVSKAVTVKNKELINMAVKIIEGLGVIGPSNLQVKVLPDGEIKVIEINPRFGGGVPLSYQAGVNYPQLIVRMMKGEKIEPFIGEFKEGLAMLRYDTPLFKNINELTGVNDDTSSNF
ncbi:ATP-grasp domain-containing protein [Halocella sp. SP3-1]|uniref:ATP-grasp domain-containing protein n=1 Tax=Halocella sp. SP3-1 TaxID=2382161 RepID=UPI000F757500|nr:ATP-grasp domain-containing protein [Halocella sp. SP3-1]AZO94025.1 ATP-grasp domain-containing protein [Halocella sp. SP3-1]